MNKLLRVMIRHQGGLVGIIDCIRAAGICKSSSEACAVLQSYLSSIAYANHGAHTPERHVMITRIRFGGKGHITPSCTTQDAIVIIQALTTLDDERKQKTIELLRALA